MSQLYFCVFAQVCVGSSPCYVPHSPADIFDTWLQGFGCIFAAPSWDLSPMHCVYYNSLWPCLFTSKPLDVFFSSSSYSLFIPNWMHLQFQPGNKPVPGNVFAGSLQHGVYLPVSALGATIKILHIHLFALGLWLTSHIRPYSPNAYRSN